MFYIYFQQRTSIKPPTNHPPMISCSNSTFSPHKNRVESKVISLRPNRELNISLKQPNHSNKSKEIKTTHPSLEPGSLPKNYLIHSPCEHRDHPSYCLNSFQKSPYPRTLRSLTFLSYDNRKFFSTININQAQ